jgi:hypothetical protein
LLPSGFGDLWYFVRALPFEEEAIIKADRGRARLSQRSDRKQKTPR